MQIEPGEGKKQNGEGVKRLRQAGQGNAGEMREFLPEVMGQQGVSGDLSRFSDVLLVDGEPMGGMDQELKRTKRKKKKRVRLPPG